MNPYVKAGLAVLCLLICAGFLFGAYKLGQRDMTVHVETSPLAIANCPNLSPLSGDDFGTTTLKLMDVAVQYRKCQAACIPPISK